MIDDKQLDELERLAKVASPGPWHVDGFLDVSAREKQGPEEGEPFVVAEIAARNHASDAAFVAAANPQTARSTQKQL
jgi:hypothetical protein